MKLVDHSKKYKYEDGNDRPDDRIIPFLDNEFVTGFKEDRLFYSKDFDIALYMKIHDEGMTYVQAYCQKLTRTCEFLFLTMYHYVIMIPIYMLCVTKKWIYLRKVGML